MLQGFLVEPFFASRCLSSRYLVVSFSVVRGCFRCCFSIDNKPDLWRALQFRLEVSLSYWIFSVLWLPFSVLSLSSLLSITCIVVGKGYCCVARPAAPPQQAQRSEQVTGEWARRPASLVVRAGCQDPETPTATHGSRSSSQRVRRRMWRFRRSWRWEWLGTELRWKLGRVVITNVFKWYSLWFLWCWILNCHWQRLPSWLRIQCITMSVWAACTSAVIFVDLCVCSVYL